MKKIIKNIKGSDFIFLFIFIITFLLILPYNAESYIDPNTGGFFFSSVLPFVYGILAAVVIFWKRIAHSIKNIFTGKKDNNDS